MRVTVASITPHAIRPTFKGVRNVMEARFGVKNVKNRRGRPSKPNR